jgi:hypothetical protein
VALIEGIPGEFGPQPWGEAILRSCGLLLRITRRPANHEVRLPGLATTPRHVVEDRTGKALTWRRDGDDLLVMLPDACELPVVRVALQGKLRIVPPDTVTANADGVWELAPSSSTAHLVGRRAAEVAVKLFGPVDASTAYRITLANHSYVVPGSALTTATIGPYAVPAGRVVALTVEPVGGPAGIAPASGSAGRLRAGGSCDWSTRTSRVVAVSGSAGFLPARVLVAPVGTVLAAVEGTEPGRLDVTITNFGRTPAQGQVYVPLPRGWTASPCQWSFEDLAPGAAATTSVALRVPPSAGEHLLTVRLDAGRRSASLAHLLS